MRDDPAALPSDGLTDTARGGATRLNDDLADRSGMGDWPLDVLGPRSLVVISLAFDILGARRDVGSAGLVRAETTAVPSLAMSQLLRRPSFRGGPSLALGLADRARRATSRTTGSAARSAFGPARARALLPARCSSAALRGASSLLLALGHRNSPYCNQLLGAARRVPWRAGALDASE